MLGAIKTKNKKCIMCGKKDRKFLKYYCSSECYYKYLNATPTQVRRRR